MDDLVNRLRANNAYKHTGIVTHAAADRIEMLEREVAASYANQVSLINRVEQLERELLQWRENYGKLGLAMEAEKVLADDLYKAWNTEEDERSDAAAAYRKAREQK